MQISRAMWKLIQAIFTILLIILSFSVKGQNPGTEVDPILIRVKARVISAADSSAVPFANVVYTRNRTATSTNAAGFFTIVMLNIDSVYISAMGFKTKVLKLPRNYSETQTLTVYLEPVVYLIKEVRVTGDKNRPNMDGIPMGKTTDIPQELRGDAFNEKPPVLAAIFNPLSYWQYYLSHREKQKRLVREAISLEKNWEMHSQNYNKEMVMKLTGLNGEEADDFMIWFNSKNVLPYTSTEYEVKAAIRSWFEVYKNGKRLH
jgi:hypothetical protein